jgi:hypothetical protein
VIIETKGLRFDTDELEFVKSTKSGPNCDMCVEVAAVPGGHVLRDSKNPTGPVLAFNDAEWNAFLEGAKAGEFDA